VHCTLAVGQALIAPSIVDFKIAHPSIRIDLEISSMPINPMELQVDVAIRMKTPRETSPGHVSIGRRILGKVRQVLVASPAYLERTGTPVSLEELKQRDCLLYTTYSTFSENWQFHNGRQEVSVKIEEPIFKSNNWMVVRDAALKGLGIARLPEFSVRSDIASGRLVLLFDDQIRSDLQVQAVFPRTARMPAKTRLLLDYLAQRISESDGRRRPSGPITEDAAAPASPVPADANRMRQDRMKVDRKARTA
jgi:DNA-binding transcriptional LysR family regulator